MKPAVHVENLAKSYRISHDARAKRDDYRTLRDTIVEAARRPLRRLRDPSAVGAVEEFWALEDVNFQVEPGEVLGIIGGNGAGKSTLLKILARITEPTRGQATLRGRIGSLLEVGTGFHPELTGRENVFQSGAILGMRRAEIQRKFDDIVQFSGVEKFLDTPVKRYSSGMRVRLAFAVAAHLEPEILLIDEVLAVGDATFQTKCLGKMDDVARAGRTVFFVSHNMGALAQLCPRCIRLDQGRLVQDGDSEEVISNYLAEDSPEGYVDLRNRKPERPRRGQMRFEFLETQDNEGRRRGEFRYHESIRFRIGIRGRESGGFISNVIIHNRLGQAVYHLNSVDDGMALVAPASTFELVVTLPENILNDGVYYVSLTLNDDMRFSQDQASNCLSFRVDNSAVRPIRGKGMVRVEAQWDLRATEGDA